MLQTLRQGAAGWVAKVFLGVLVLSFAVWGIADVFRFGGRGEYAAIVGDRKISVDEYRNAYTNELRRISNQAKRVITPEQARAAGIGDKVLGDLVNEAAIDSHVKKLGLSVSDDDIAREIQNDETFRGPNGSFDRTTFQDILRANNLGENQYLRLQRSFTARRQLTTAIMADMAPPLALRQAIHAYNSDSRSISYVEVTPEEPSAVPAPAPNALQKYFDDHKKSFSAPEYRKLAYLALDPKAMAASVDVPESDLKAYYEKHKPSYAEPEKRAIEQIPFPSMEQAKAASDEIKKGALFEQIMVKRKMKPEDAFLGNLTKSQVFDPKIADAAFGLKVGEVSEPIEGSYSTVLLRVTGIQQQKIKDFAAVRDQIRDVIAEDKAKEAASALHDKIDDARLGGATLEEISKAQNVPVRVIDAVDRSGKGPDGNAVGGLPLADQLLDGAFRTEPGADAEPVVSGDTFVWYSVRGVTPPRDRSFEEARAAVEQRWREEEARKRLDARADGMLADLKAGKPLDQIASAQKLEVQQAETTRSGGAPSITGPEASAVFAAPVDGPGVTPADEKGAKLVFRVTSENIRPFDPNAADDSGQIDKIGESMGGDIVSAFVRRLRDALGTRFDPAAIAQVTGGGAG